MTFAKAFGKQAIDLVCIDYKDSEKLKSESIDGKNLGFTGKVSSITSYCTFIFRWLICKFNK